MKSLTNNVLLIFAVVVLAFTGCSKSADNVEVKGATSDVAQEVAKPLDGKKLIIAINATFAPFESVAEVKDGKEVLEGLDIDLIEMLAEKLGFSYEFNDMAFSGLIGALSSGRADVIISGISATEERKESVDFTRSYFTPLCAILSPESSVYSHLNELSGKTVAVSFGTTFQALAEGIDGVTVSAVDSTAIAFQELVSGRADACLFDNNQALTFQAENKGYVAKTLSPEEAAQKPYAIACQKGSEMTAIFDKALAELEEEGALDQLIIKWLGEEYLAD